MANSKYIKMYAAFKAGLLGNNIMEKYYHFFANIIYEEGMEEIDVNVIINKFRIKYDYPLTPPFVRQVLSEGVSNGSIIYDKGKHIANRPSLKQYQLSDSEFESKWKSLIDDFHFFCNNNYFVFNKETVEQQIIDMIEKDDVKNIIDEELSPSSDAIPFSYSWHKFIKYISTNNLDLFDFIAFLGASFSFMDALFLVGKNEQEKSDKDDFRGLNVYLDTPMIFALLGMDSKERTQSYNQLVKNMQDAGCIVQVLDNNFNEATGILERAGTWAVSPYYNIAKANKVAKYFHDSEMTLPDIIEYNSTIETILNTMGITVKETNFDTYEDLFQESEDVLFKVVKEKYEEQQLSIPEDKLYSVQLDIRSIIMIYRMRQGATSTNIQSSRHILLTLNGLIANASKCYESNKSINSGHVPACISADLFGAVLWLNNPEEILEYQKKKLLADCYSALQPSKKMLDKLVSSLETAKAMGEIDENKYILMRSHSVVSDALMNVLQGDYARFNDRTYIEVYDDIMGTANKNYTDEALRHKETLKKLQITEKEVADQDDRYSKLENEYQIYKKQQEKKEQDAFDNKCNIIGTTIAVIITGVPYVLAATRIEFLMSKCSSKETLTNAILLAILIVTAAILTKLFSKLKNCLSKFFSNVISKKLQESDPIK